MSLIWFSEFELCRLQIQQNYCFTLLAIKKVPQLRLFPSVACSSYFGYFVQFSRCVLVSKTRSKHSLFCKCLHPSLEKMVGPSGLEPPTSRLSVVRSSQLSYGPILDRAGWRVQVFWQCQNLAAGGIHFRRGSSILPGHPFQSQIKMGWWR